MKGQAGPWRVLTHKEGSRFTTGSLWQGPCKDPRPHVILTGSSLGLSCIPTQSQRHPLCKDKQVLGRSSPIRRARDSPLGPYGDDPVRILDLM